jgi:hypothetical protein
VSGGWSADMAAAGDEPRVTLYAGVVQPGTTTFQGVYVSSESGDLVFEAQDVGALPLEIFGDSDYEWWVTVAASDKPAVLAALRAEHGELAIEGEGDAPLLALLEAVFGGRRDAVDAVRRWLDEKPIAYSFSSWI